MRSRTFPVLSVLLIIALLLEIMFNAPLSSQAQSSPTAPATTSAADDSDELPVLVNLTGKVQAITATTLRINDTIVIIPSTYVLPSSIQVGVLVTIRANLHNDDTIIIISLLIGAPTPTPVETEEPETPEPTLQVTSAPTLTSPPPTATAQPTIVLPTIPNCGLAKQPLGLLIAATYGIPYAEVIGWHCKGFTFGVIARAYLIVLTGQEQSKPTTIVIILDLRLRGKHWGAIIIILDIYPEPESLIVIINPGQVIVVTWDCNYLKKHNKGLYNKNCKKPKKEKKPKK